MTLKEFAGDLFATRKVGERIVGGLIVPISCEIHERAAVMTGGEARMAKALMPGIEAVIGYYTVRAGGVGVGVRTHLLTYVARDEHGVELGAALHGTEGTVIPYHVFSFPVRKTWRDEVSVDLMTKSARELIHIIEHKHSKNELTEIGPGALQRPIALPRIGLGSKGLTSWASLKKQLEAWFIDDTFVVIGG